MLEATHRDQIRRLERTRRLAHELRVALLRRDAKRVATLLERFRAASRSRRDLPALEQRSRAAYAHRMRTPERRIRCRPARNRAATA